METSRFYDRYNEIMYDERDCIERFLKDQYDLRYGHQRDTWHFEPAIELIGNSGTCYDVTDIKLDNSKFVVFCVDFLGEKQEWDCFNFAYGELSKVIEALPNAKDIVRRNATEDLCAMTKLISIDQVLYEHPFRYEANGKHYTCCDVKLVDGALSLVQALGNDTPASDMPLEVITSLRDHININFLHEYSEYKKLAKFLSEQPNLRFEPSNFGDVEFTIHGTDVKVDVLSASLDSNGRLQLCVDDDGQETLLLEEKDIRPEYLVDLVGYIEDHCYYDIMDDRNAHNPELVRKINAAWRSKKYHDCFGTILLALLTRDKKEFEDRFDCDVELTEEFAYINAHQIMEGVCDDWDLETILSFIRYK